MNEIWKTIPCDELGGKYEISNTGFVRNAVNKNVLAKKFISAYNTAIRMRSVKGEAIWRPLQWLLAKTFVSNPNNYTSIDYIDGNCDNICAENITWVCAKTDLKYRVVENLPGEIWKEIPNYPFYNVSNFGRVKVLADDADVPNVDFYTKPRYEELLSLTPGKGGYLFVTLGYKCTTKTFPVHRLVAIAFIPNLEHKLHIDHIDRNTCNNNVENLRWVTAKENASNTNRCLKVSVTDIDGNTTIYNTITDVAEALNLRISTVKSRASRAPKMKDGYIIQFLDKSGVNGTRNKRKGNAFEVKVNNDLRDIGFNTVTSRSESKKTDNNKIDIIDLDNNLPCNIQTKYTSTTPSYFTIREQCTDKEKPFCIVWKKAISDKNSPGTVAMIPYEFFLELMKQFANK